MLVSLCSEMAGRPKELVPQDKANEIVEWISNGKPLREFCRIEGNPAFRTVYDWLEKDEAFSARFARARESGEDVIAQECLEIADDARNDWMETKQGKVLDSEHVQRSRLRIDTRLKLLSKWNPKKYGDKVQSEVSGPNGAPIQAEIKVEFVKPDDKI